MNNKEHFTCDYEVESVGSLFSKDPEEPIVDLENEDWANLSAHSSDDGGPVTWSLLK